MSEPDFEWWKTDELRDMAGDPDVGPQWQSLYAEVVANRSLRADLRALADQWERSRRILRVEPWKVQRECARELRALLDEGDE